MVACGKKEGDALDRQHHHETRQADVLRQETVGKLMDGWQWVRHSGVFTEGSPERH